MTTNDNSRQDLILNAWKKIGKPQLTDEMIKIISQASGKSIQEIKQTLKEEND